MQEFLRQPGFLGTHGNMGADLSYTLTILFTTTYLIAWRQARKTHGQRHHVLILWGMLVMLAYFTLYYLTRQLGALAFKGEEGFGGPVVLYRCVFRPLLTIHIINVTIALVMAIYLIFLGFRSSARQSGNRILVAGTPKVSPGLFYFWTLNGSVLMGFVFFLGRGLFKGFSIPLLADWIVVFILIGLALMLVEWIGTRWYLDGERRHRAMGTFTMYQYILIPITSTPIYFMLYVIYPPKI